jgi:hypothetical protein
MTSTEATAEVSLTALRALPQKERDAVLVRIANESDLREDLLDMALIAGRRDEKPRPFREYLAEESA